MARADFYIVDEQVTPHRFVCQLVEKARHEGCDVHIHAASRDEAATLDDLLWTFRDTSFLPHAAIDAAGAATDCPVLIGWEGEPPRSPQAQASQSQASHVLINLSDTVPTGTHGYERIIEIVPSDPAARRQARLRYQDYRDRGLAMHSHDMQAGRA